MDAPEGIRGVAGTLGQEAGSGVLLKLIRFRPFGVKGPLRQQPQTSMEYMRALEAQARAAGFQNVMII